MAIPIPDSVSEVLGVSGSGSLGMAERIARRTVADREAEYSHEVRRLLDAGLAAIARNGTTSSPRVAEVVAEAGLSNDVFYRHFRSKDELVTAILEEGTVQVQRHLARKMAEVDDPAEQLRIWVVGVLDRATTPQTADIIRALLWNSARVSDDSQRRLSARELMGQPLRSPISRLGSADPDRDARVVCQATMGRLEEFLWRRETPTPEDFGHLVQFCLHAVRGGTPNDDNNGGTDERG